MQKVIIGSRGSKLALWQANHMQSLLTGLGRESEIHIIKTKGDKIQNLSFDKIEGKGFFTKEIEDALLEGKVDIAVHSHKDLETEQPAGLKIASVPDREDARDVLLIREDKYAENTPVGLAPGASVGTSSIRRRTQILHLDASLSVQELRGNVPTRIQKLKDGNYDAIILAHAGLLRLDSNTDGIVVKPLPVDTFVPAPAQGALAIQIRENDVELEELLGKTSNPKAKNAVEVERVLLNRLNGGCHLPFGAHCYEQGDGLCLHLAYAAPNKDIKYTTFTGKDSSELIDLGWKWLNEEV